MSVIDPYYSNRKDDRRCTMTGVRIGVSADDRIRSRARWARVKRSAKAGLLSAVVVVCIIPFAAESADDLKPPANFRNWYHVNTMIVDKDSPLFKDLGGMHNVYINTTGEAALKKGGPYPDKSSFLTDLHDFTVSEGSYVEGPRKAIA